MNEQLFHVDSVIDVVDRSGKIIGTLHPGHDYRVIDESSLEFAVGVTYVMLRLPDHSAGYVAQRHLRSGSASESDFVPELEPDNAGGPGARPSWLTAATAGGLAIVGLVVGLGAASFLIARDDTDSVTPTAADALPATTTADAASTTADAALTTAVVESAAPEATNLTPDSRFDDPRVARFAPFVAQAGFPRLMTLGARFDYNDCTPDDPDMYHYAFEGLSRQRSWVFITTYPSAERAEAAFEALAAIVPPCVADEQDSVVEAVAVDAEADAVTLEWTIGESLSRYEYHSLRGDVIVGAAILGVGAQSIVDLDDGKRALAGFG